VRGGPFPSLGKQRSKGTRGEDIVHEVDLSGGTEILKRRSNKADRADKVRSVASDFLGNAGNVLKRKKGKSTELKKPRGGCS